MRLFNSLAASVINTLWPVSFAAKTVALALQAPGYMKMTYCPNAGLLFFDTVELGQIDPFVADLNAETIKALEFVLLFRFSLMISGKQMSLVSRKGTGFDSKLNWNSRQLLKNALKNWYAVNEKFEDAVTVIETSPEFAA